MISTITFLIFYSEVEMVFRTISRRVTLYLTITTFFNMSQCDFFFVIVAIFLIK